LKDIVSKGILDKSIGIRGDLSDELSFLVSRRVINAALENAAAMTVCADSHAIFSHGIEDELWKLAAITLRLS
jgi:hypothetical protein